MLEVKSVTKRFAGLVAVNNVSFDVAADEIVGIVGANGSGKTTLFSMISGQLRPTSGEVILKGVPIGGAQPHRVARMGLVKTFQNPQLFMELTCLEHMLIAGHLRLKSLTIVQRLAEILRGSRSAFDASLRKQAEACLDRCHLLPVTNELVANLSYGQEKMLGVAMALMCDPKILLLDEPASGLGEGEMANLTDVIRALRDRGTAVCLIDHRIAFLRRLADKVVAINQGSVVTAGTADEVFSHPRVVQSYLGGAHA